VLRWVVVVVLVLGGVAHADPYRRASTTSDHFELTARWRGEAIDLYLADPDTNAPLAATLALRWSDGSRAAAVAAEPGVFSATHAEGDVDLTASVMAAGRSDLLTLSALHFGPEPAPATAHDEHPQPWLWIVLGLVALVVVGAAGFVAGRGRRTHGAVALLLAVLVPWRVSAHGGDAHDAPVQQTRSGEAHVVAKELQFLLGVRTARAETRMLTERLRVPGTVVADGDARAEVRVPRAGRLELDAHPLPRRGQHVSAGEVLAILVDLPPSADLATLQADRARERGTSAAIAARLVALRAELSRKDALADVTAPQEREQLRAEVHALEAQARASRAATDQLDAHDLGRVALTAPIDGVVSDVAASVGAFVAENERLFTIVRPDGFVIAAHVFEREALGVTDGDALVSAATTFSAARLSASPAVDPTTRAVELRYAGSGPLLLDQYVDVDVPVGPARALVVVPATAIDQQDGHPVVYVKTAPEAFVARPVAVVARAGDDVGVSGLEPGARVVVRGLAYVR